MMILNGQVGKGIGRDRRGLYSSKQSRVNILRDISESGLGSCGSFKRAQKDAIEREKA